MVKLGIVVEGHSDKLFVESPSFVDLCRSLNIEVMDVFNATGNGNLCSANIELYIKELGSHAEIDQILVLADLDPEACAPCITKRKERIGDSADKIVIIRNAIETLFLADHDFLKKNFHSSIPSSLCETCESILDPFEKLSELNLTYKKRGLKSKKQFMKRNGRHLNLIKAAKHSASAQYLLNKLESISQNT